jgi:hypothetical protein
MKGANSTFGGNKNLFSNYIASRKSGNSTLGGRLGASASGFNPLGASFGGTH